MLGSSPSRFSGVVAAGHPLSAQAGAAALRAGGNAVDAAIGAMFASFAAEPVLTGLGAGGYMLVVRPGEEPVLLDFFVESPGREAVRGEPAAGKPGGEAPQPDADLIPVDVSFGDAEQVFHVGAASVGCYGVPAGICEAARRFGSLPLESLAMPAVDLARAGVVVNTAQAYVIEILGGILTSTPEARALFAPEGRLLQPGEELRQPELAGALERLAVDGSEPFYTGDIATAIADWIGDHGGLLGRADLAAYRVVDRDPVHVAYRGHDVLTNAPPSAGGLLIAHTLGQLAALDGAPSVEALVEAMERTQAARTADFLAGLHDPSFRETFLRSSGRLGRRRTSRCSTATAARAR